MKSTCREQQRLGESEENGFMYPGTSSISSLPNLWCSISCFAFLFFSVRVCVCVCLCVCVCVCFQLIGGLFL